MLCLLGVRGSNLKLIEKEFINNGYSKVIEVTNRPQNNGEIDGIDYYFKTILEIAELKNDDDIVLWKEQNGIVYGVCESDIEENSVLIVTPGDMESIEDNILEETDYIYIKCTDNEIRQNLTNLGYSYSEIEEIISEDKENYKEIEDIADYIIESNSRTPSSIVFEFERDKEKDIEEDKQSDLDFVEEMKTIFKAKGKYLIPLGILIYIVLHLIANLLTYAVELTGIMSYEPNISIVEVVSKEDRIDRNNKVILDNIVTVMDNKNNYVVEMSFSNNLYDLVDIGDKLYVEVTEISKGLIYKEKKLKYRFSSPSSEDYSDYQSKSKYLISISHGEEDITYVIKDKVIGYYNYSNENELKNVHYIIYCSEIKNKSDIGGSYIFRVSASEYRDLSIGNEFYGKVKSLKTIYGEEYKVYKLNK